ncbi:glycine-rich protein 1 isoform X2 [Drosophila sulfurigaster albostrigata]|uniref:glycine-rich protein 1 isoform X2 n=1 Tax=Drosophila sulfurigaster albostrigata TaxID=89887 RepID=UPI002D21896C|nr:glycine-rich protein 1 isoform X2 [Drosophila sulfurigaster albostrigata]
MLMLPLLEYNKHIAKIPNCKMRSSPLRLSMLLQSLRLLLLLWMLLDAAAATSSSNSNGNSNGPSAAAGAAGGASAASGAGAGGGGGAAAGPALPPGALNANLTDLGSPAHSLLLITN